MPSWKDKVLPNLQFHFRQVRLAARGLGFNTLWTNTSTSTKKVTSTKCSTDGFIILHLQYSKRWRKSGLGLQPYWNLRSMRHGPDLTLPGLKLQTLLLETPQVIFPPLVTFRWLAHQHAPKLPKYVPYQEPVFNDVMSNATHTCASRYVTAYMLFELFENRQRHAASGADDDAAIAVVTCFCTLSK